MAAYNSLEIKIFPYFAISHETGACLKYFVNDCRSFYLFTKSATDLRRMFYPQAFFVLHYSPLFAASTAATSSIMISLTTSGLTSSQQNFLLWFELQSCPNSLFESRSILQTYVK